jgi:hypothetical protein
LAGFGACVGRGRVIIIGAHDILEIVFEPLSDCFSVLVDNQSLAMGQHERGLIAQRARCTNVQNLIWINEDFFTGGR